MTKKQQQRQQRRWSPTQGLLFGSVIAASIVWALVFSPNQGLFGVLCTTLVGVLAPLAWTPTSETGKALQRRGSKIFEVTRRLSRSSSRWLSMPRSSSFSGEPSDGSDASEGDLRVTAPLVAGPTSMLHEKSVGIGSLEESNARAQHGSGLQNFPDGGGKVSSQTVVEGDGDSVGLSEVSVLGLQTSVRYIPGDKVASHTLVEGDVDSVALNDASVLGLQTSVQFIPGNTMLKEDWADDVASELKVDNDAVDQQVTMDEVVDGVSRLQVGMKLDKAVVDDVVQQIAMDDVVADGFSRLQVGMAFEKAVVKDVNSKGATSMLVEDVEGTLGLHEARAVGFQTNMQYIPAAKARVTEAENVEDESFRLQTSVKVEKRRGKK